MREFKSSRRVDQSTPEDSASVDSDKEPIVLLQEELKASGEPRGARVTVLQLAKEALHMASDVASQRKDRTSERKLQRACKEVLRLIEDSFLTRVAKFDPFDGVLSFPKHLGTNF